MMPENNNQEIDNALREARTKLDEVYHMNFIKIETPSFTDRAIQKIIDEIIAVKAASSLQAGGKNDAAQKLCEDNNINIEKLEERGKEIEEHLKSVAALCRKIFNDCKNKAAGLSVSLEHVDSRSDVLRRATEKALLAAWDYNEKSLEYKGAAKNLETSMKDFDQWVINTINTMDKQGRWDVVDHSTEQPPMQPSLSSTPSQQKKHVHFDESQLNAPQKEQREERTQKREDPSFLQKISQIFHTDRKKDSRSESINNDNESHPKP